MTTPLHILLDGEVVAVNVRRNAQARRMILRVCPRSGDVKLTMPTRARMGAATRFVEEHIDWIVRERGKAAIRETVGQGASLPFLGLDRTLHFSGTAPRRVTLDGETLVVGGPADLAPRRLLGWLKEEARARLDAASRRHAATLDVAFSRISIGDMKSRWGSCSARGTLRYNWRLVMAPEQVLDYVAAHEVSHLLEMNHSDRFWAHVATCDPAHKEHRRWLKRNGAALFDVTL